MNASVNPYLSFDSNCEEAFTLYAKVLGGTILAMLRNSDAPPGGPPTIPGRESKIMHSTLQIGSTFLMGSDMPPNLFKPVQGCSVAVQIEDPAAAERAFNALAEGGTVTMPMIETFFAVKFGTLTDRFGTPWIINSPRPDYRPS